MGADPATSQYLSLTIKFKIDVGPSDSKQGMCLSDFELSMVGHLEKASHFLLAAVSFRMPGTPSLTFFVLVPRPDPVQLLSEV